VIVLGCDPGAWLGWAALAIEGGDARYLDAGVLSVDELGEDRARDRVLLAAARVGAELVALERVRRVLPTLAFQRGAAAQAGRLVDGAWLGGEIAQGCRAAGRHVVMCQADDVRRHFIAPTGVVGRGQKKPDMDAVVLAACNQRIAFWPPRIRGEGAAYRKDGADLMSNRRSHAADAALLALFAGLQALQAAPPRALAPAPRQEPLFREARSR